MKFAAMRIENVFEILSLKKGSILFWLKRSNDFKDPSSTKVTEKGLFLEGYNSLNK